MLNVEACSMYLRWCSKFGFLNSWAGVCQVRFFPGDNPDVRDYAHQVSKKCDAVRDYLHSGFSVCAFHPLGSSPLVNYKVAPDLYPRCEKLNVCQFSHFELS